MRRRRLGFILEKKRVDGRVQWLSFKIFIVSITHLFFQSILWCVRSLTMNFFKTTSFETLRSLFAYWLWSFVMILFLYIYLKNTLIFCISQTLKVYVTCLLLTKICCFLWQHKIVLNIFTKEWYNSKSKVRDHWFCNNDLGSDKPHNIFWKSPF